MGQLVQGNVGEYPRHGDEPEQQRRKRVLPDKIPQRPAPQGGQNQHDHTQHNRKPVDDPKLFFVVHQIDGGSGGMAVALRQGGIAFHKVNPFGWGYY